MAVQANNQTGMLQDIPFSFATFNLHGFNQGGSLLSELCSTYDLDIDCIFIQEHWLTPANLDKIKNYSNSHTFFGISAMEGIIESSVLKGRPWGGGRNFIKNFSLQFG